MARPTRSHADQSGSSSAAGEQYSGWERRIYAGLQLPGVPADVRAALAQALGAVGVEGEYLLRLLAAFTGPEGVSSARGDHFLDQLQAFAYRLIDAANALELATQSYLTALDAAEMASEGGTSGLAMAAAQAEPWWPPDAGYTPRGESLELRLRRCGFSYRQMVAVHLGTTVEAIAEQMGLVLHALNSLPPAGILSAAVLSQGLDELTDAVQGDVVPHRLLDVSEELPGLLSAIERLRAPAAHDDSSLGADITWARAEYERVLTSAPAAPQNPGLFGRLFGRASMDPSRRWNEAAAQEWRELIAALEAMQHVQPRRPPASAP